jgi:hypothetical protein
MMGDAMSDLKALAVCVKSGQVPDETVPKLCAEVPGLREVLLRANDNPEMQLED